MFATATFRDASDISSGRKPPFTFQSGDAEAAWNKTKVKLQETAKTDPAAARQIQVMDFAAGVAGYTERYYASGVTNFCDVFREGHSEQLRHDIDFAPTPRELIGALRGWLHYEQAKQVFRPVRQLQTKYGANGIRMQALVAIEHDW